MTTFYEPIKNDKGEIQYIPRRDRESIDPSCERACPKTTSPPLVGGDEGEGEGSPGLSDRLKRVFTYGLEWIMEDKALLSDDEWPESLHEKLKGFVVK